MRLIRVGLALIGVLILVGCNSAPVQPAQTSNSDAASAAGSTGAIRVGAMQQLTGATVQVLAVERPMKLTDPDGFYKTKSGMQWVGVTVRTCVAEDSLLSWQPWALTDQAGAQYLPEILGQNASVVPLYPDGARPFKAGECAQGVIPFQAPAGATTVRYAVGYSGQHVEVVTWK